MLCYVMLCYVMLCYVMLCYVMFLEQQPPLGQSLLIHEVSRSHTTTHHNRYDSSWRVISPTQRPLPDNTQHSQQTNIHASGGIRTHNLTKWAAADLLLRPRGHWDRPCNNLGNHKVTVRQWYACHRCTSSVPSLCISWRRIMHFLILKWNTVANMFCRCNVLRQLLSFLALLLSYTLAFLW